MDGLQPNSDASNLLAMASNVISELYIKNLQLRKQQTLFSESPRFGA